MVGSLRLGVLIQPVCSSIARYPVVILEFDSILREYILQSQTSPSQISPLPPSPPAVWSATNLQGQSLSSPIDLSIILPDNNEPLICQTTQNGSELFLGVRPPEEFDTPLSLSGVVFGSIYVDFPSLPPPPVFPPLPPPLIYNNTLVDQSFPTDFEYPLGFLWPSQVYTFYSWYYILYGGSELPPLEELPYISTQLL
jgi:hypothetical protein